jgi:hypothetical protein
LGKYRRFSLLDRYSTRERILFHTHFSALPKECKVFDFVEEVIHGSGFLVTDIERNESDVYTLKLT